MHRVWLPALAVVLAACGGSPKPTSSSGLEQADAKTETASNPFLDRIPADTPYFYVSTVSSAEYMRGRLDNPAWREVVAGLERAEKRDPEAFASLAINDKLVFALLSELGPEPARGSARLGVPMSARFAIYGLELWPVVRLELDDPGLFRSALDRIETRIGVESTVSQRSGYEIRRYVADDMILLVAVGDRDLALAMTTAEVLEPTLAALVDPGVIQDSLAEADTVRRLVARHRLPSSFVGAVDFARIAAVLADLAGRGLGALGGGDDASAQCLRELAASPTIAAFGGSVAADGIHGKISIEIDPERASRLSRSRVAIPGSSRAETEGARVALALGVDIGTALGEIRAQLAEAGKRFGACTGFASATGMIDAAIAQVLMTPVGQVRGASLLLREGHLAASPLRIDHAVAFVGASDPTAMVALTAALLSIPAPVLSPGAPPQRFEVASAFGDVAHLGLSRELFGLALGAGAETELAAKLAEPPRQPGPLLLVRLDPKLLVALQGEGEPENFATLAAADPKLATALREVEANDLLRFRDILFTVDLEEAAIAIHIDMLFSDR